MPRGQCRSSSDSSTNDLDGDLAWLEQRGARVVERSTGNPRTTGVRFDTRSLTEALARQAGELRLDDRAPRASRARPDRPRDRRVPGKPGARAGVDHPRGRRAVPPCDAVECRATASRSAARPGHRSRPGMDEFYGRNMPAPPAHITEAQLVPLAQLYAQHAVVEDAEGEQYEPHTWSEIDVVQWTARRPGARVTYRIREERLGSRSAGVRSARWWRPPNTPGRRSVASSGVGARRRRRGDHDDARRPRGEHGRARRARRLRGGVRRRRDLDGRLLERARRGPRPRADRRSVGAGGPMTFPFGSEFTVGIEEELFLVEEATLALSADDGRGPRRDAGRPAGRGA